MSAHPRNPIKVKLKDLRATQDHDAAPDGFLKRFKDSLISPTLFFFVVILPTVLSAIYWFLIAANIYVSEAKFVVRTPAESGGAGGIGAVIQSSAISKSTDDAHAINSYLRSRDAMMVLVREAGMDAAYGPSKGDFLARFPGFLRGKTEESRFKYFQAMTDVLFDKGTAISTLTVQAFDPHDAQRMAERLLVAGEQLANRITVRMREDMLSSANNDAREARERAAKAQADLTRWRDREQQIDPARYSNAMIEVIARLSLELALLRAQIDEIQKSSPQSPTIASLERRVDSLKKQILTEKASLTAGGDSLASKLVEYEHIQLERQFAERLFSSAVASQEHARTEAQRQQIYVERIVSPQVADYPRYPYRFLMVIGTLVGSVMLYLILSRVLLNISRHGAFQRYFDQTQSA